MKGYRYERKEKETTTTTTTTNLNRKLRNQDLKTIYPKEFSHNNKYEIKPDKNTYK